MKTRLRFSGSFGKNAAAMNWPPESRCRTGKGRSCTPRATTSAVPGRRSLLPGGRIPVVLFERFLRVFAGALVLTDHGFRGSVCGLRIQIRGSTEVRSLPAFYVRRVEWQERC